MENYWETLADTPHVTKEDFFLKMRDQYTLMLRHIFDDPVDIPDFRIHFCTKQVTLSEGAKTGFPVETVSRRSNLITERRIQDLTQLENFENSYTWYKNDIFIMIDYRETGITPFTFITHEFMKEFLTQAKGDYSRIRIGRVSDYIIQSGINEFFYQFFRIDVNFLQNLSATTYESDYADSRVIVSRTDGRGSRRTRRNGLKVAFSDPIEFSFENLRQVRKMLELSKNTMALVVGDNGKIRGLTDEEFTPNECEININGHLSWSIVYDGTKMLSYNSGKYHIFRAHEYVTNLKNFLSDEKEELTQAQVNAISSVIVEASKQIHGTIILVGSPDAIEEETERFTTSRYAIGISSTNLFENRDIISALTSVDGALLMDTRCNCSCIGAILDGDIVAKGSMARGSRFNSTQNYVLRRSQLGQKFTGIVISEDGTVDAVTKDKVFRINLSREKG